MIIILLANQWVPSKRENLFWHLNTEILYIKLSKGIHTCRAWNQLNLMLAVLEADYSVQQIKSETLVTSGGHTEKLHRPVFLNIREWVTY